MIMSMYIKIKQVLRLALFLYQSTYSFEAASVSTVVSVFESEV